MSTSSTGAWIVAVFSDSTSTMSVRMSVVVTFTLPVLSLVDLAFRRRFGSDPPAGEQRSVFSGFSSQQKWPAPGMRSTWALASRS